MAGRVGPGLAGAVALDTNAERWPTGTFAQAEQLIGQKRYREAIRYCRRELAASPRCVTLRLWLARALLADEAGAAGVAELEECLRIDPTSQAARKMLVELGVDVPFVPSLVKQPPKVRDASIPPLPPPPPVPPVRSTPVRATPPRATRAPEPVRPTPSHGVIAPSPRVVYQSPLAPSPVARVKVEPLPRIEPVLPKIAPVRIAHDPPARKKREASRRQRAFSSPFATDEAPLPKPSRAAARWERPLAIEARKPQPLMRVALVVILLVGLMALWRLGREDAKGLPTASVAASRPTPEPPVTKPDAPTLDGLGSDVWIHPLAGPERRMPVHDSRLFGAERTGDRPSECRGGHCGIDLAGAYGEPVYAVHDGICDRVRRDANPDHGGHYVRLKHRDGTIATQYFHLSEIPRRLAEGVKVKAGDVVGYVGLTGVKHSEPHLHFTIEVQDPTGQNARYLDPEPLVALWPLRVSQKGDEHLRVATAPPGLARGFLRKRKRPHHHASADSSIAD